MLEIDTSTNSGVSGIWASLRLDRCRVNAEELGADIIRCERYYTTDQGAECLE